MYIYFDDFFAYILFSFKKNQQFFHKGTLY